MFPRFMRERIASTVTPRIRAAWSTVTLSPVLDPSTPGAYWSVPGPIMDARVGHADRWGKGHGWWVSPIRYMLGNTGKATLSGSGSAPVARGVRLFGKPL